MIKCPDCNKKISIHADTCPGCGFPLAKNRQKMEMESKLRRLQENEKLLSLEIKKMEEKKKVWESRATKWGCALIALLFIAVFIAILLGPSTMKEIISKLPQFDSVFKLVAIFIIGVFPPLSFLLVICFFKIQMIPVRKNHNQVTEQIRDLAEKISSLGMSN